MKAFAIMEKENTWGELKWCFCFGVDRTVTGVGPDNKRWFDSYEELITLLTKLGISPGKYDVLRGTQKKA